MFGMTDSAHDGEAANAGPLANRIVKDRGCTWEQVIIPAAVTLWDWRRAAQDILASESETAWERDFCWSLIGRWRGPVLTSRQEETFRRIHEKCCRRSAAA
jgi:hypothetical protein